MLKSIKKFINLPIISIRESKKVAIAKDFIVNPLDGSIIGIIVDKKGFFVKKYLVISGLDVREISEKAIIIDDRKSVVPQKEIIQLDMILKSKIKVIGSKVFSKEGVYIGKVYDYAVDDFFYIAKLYVNPPLSNILINQFIIDAEDIIEIKKDCIIIKEKNKVMEPEKSGVL
ncbi:MAG: PRC-barrel domain-containing protein [Candidatus Woesearchaeota archaeon]